jgi:hypothetical protein
VLRSRQPWAIAMWDFSWLERRWPGAGYEDWDLALDELAERGYDAVRIDAYPHLVSADPNRHWELLPKWTQNTWGAQSPIRVQVLPGLVQFIAKARDRGIGVGLSTWFREDRDNTRMGVTSADRMAAIWIDTLRTLEAGDVLDDVLYVDLCNEFPILPSAPFLYVGRDTEWLRPSDAGVLDFLTTSIAAVRSSYPDLSYTYSFTADYPLWEQQDLSSLDLFEPHLWMASEEWTDFYERVGWSWNAFAPDGFDNLVANGRRVYFDDQERYDQALFDAIDRAAQWSAAAGRPLVTTEGWAVVDYKDWPGLDWDWVLDLNARAVEHVVRTGRWAGVCTSNFCGPQFRGVWREVDYHRRLTSLIRSAPVADHLRAVPAGSSHD